MQERKIILASASASRASILKNAGLKFVVHPARINEKTLKVKALSQGASAELVGKTLANEKAMRVSSIKKNKEKFVLGADQVLSLQNKLFDKPKTLKEAETTLKKLRGKTHTLISCSAVFRNGEKIFEGIDRADLKMREFSDAFLQSYLKTEGRKLFSSVGAYQLEKKGAQLFEWIDGDYFTILGLPLFQILSFFRKEGILKE